LDRKTSWYRTPLDRDLLKRLTRWLNELFYRLFCFLAWNNPLQFRISHMLHHQYTVHRGLDKEVILEPISFTALDYISWFLFDFRKFKTYMFPHFTHFVGKADVDFYFWDPLFPPGDRRRTQMCNWARLLILGHVLLAGLLSHRSIRSPDVVSVLAHEFPYRAPHVRGGALLVPAPAA
jgi:hypothetical protein